MSGMNRRELLKAMLGGVTGAVVVARAVVAPNSASAAAPAGNVTQRADKVASETDQPVEGEEPTAFLNGGLLGGPRGFLNGGGPRGFLNGGGPRGFLNGGGGLLGGGPGFLNGGGPRGFLNGGYGRGGFLNGGGGRGFLNGGFPNGWGNFF